VNITQHTSLKSYNSFGITAYAKHFISISSTEELKEVLSLKNYPKKFILGGGSNMLLTKNLDALVIHINNKGKQCISEHKNHVVVEANAGENWHEFVLWCIENNYGGIENLSLIPGNVGTAPIQNIGAYGIELKDCFVGCKAIHIETLQERYFDIEDCEFGYRNSVFKNKLKGQYIITSVLFRLTSKTHIINTSYGAIQQELDAMQITEPSIKNVSDAVIAIRQRKLPDPKEIGNSGSFFKNPVISTEQFETLQANFPNIPSYKLSEDLIKIPAGWLIEHAGFKGKRLGDYGVHDKQALVLVNHGNAKGKDIFKLSKLIQATISRIFNINLEAEVNII